MTFGEFGLGDMLLREQLITEAQLAEALRQQRAHRGYIPLGQMLVSLKILTPRQLKMVLDRSAKRPKLGEVLIRSGAITSVQLEKALDQQKNVGKPLGQILIRMGLITDEVLREAVGVQLDVPYVDLDRIELDPKLSRVINRSYASRHGIIPIARVSASLTVCMDDPTDVLVIEELSQFTGMLLTVVTSSHAAIARAFERLYNPSAAVDVPQPTRPVDPPVSEDAQPPATSPETPTTVRPPVRRPVPPPRPRRALGVPEPARTSAHRPQPPAANLELLTDQHADPPARAVGDSQPERADDVVRRLLSIAIDHDASDIHLEMLANRLQIRFRIDGLLESIDLGDLQATCDESAREIISRFKILGRLDIAERRRPQDGRFRLRVERRGEQREIDLRLSIVPSHYGESVVVRVLDRKKAPTSLVELDFPAQVSDALRQLLARPSGMLLVTGPTGSGKSTTVYASLMTVYSPSIRVLTAEDPIEYLYEQFSQSEVNEQIGNTFPHYLRAFLRHDPEVIMVGEIRDDETAAMAFRAAQTGHLLLSTLHTNSAVETIQRLREMKVDANTLASSLLGVLNQRLARRVCANCRTEYEPAADLLREFYESRPAAMKFYKGKGCRQCSYTGYRGRLTVAELWAPSQSDIVMISKGVPSEELRTSVQANMFSMADAAMHRLRDGRTNLEELIRVLPYQVVYDFRRRLGSGGSRMLPTGSTPEIETAPEHARPN